MLYTIENGRRVINGASGTFKADGRKASPNYVAISPDVIRDKLAAAGFEVTMSFPRFHNRPMRRTVMTVQRESQGYFFREANPDSYEDMASLCFDHQGRMTLRGQPGALRIGCDNEFLASPMRIHHCSDAARDFLENPVPYVEKLMHLGRWLPERIESLRGVYGRQTTRTYALWLKALRPRLAGRVLYRLPRYTAQDADSPWAFVQACTDAQHLGRRSSQLDDLVTNLLTVGYDALRQGAAPVGDALLTVKPQLYDFDFSLN